jgi:hypothetical protein
LLCRLVVLLYLLSGWLVMLTELGSILDGYGHWLSGSVGWLSMLLGFLSMLAGYPGYTE